MPQNIEGKSTQDAAIADLKNQIALLSKRIDQLENFKEDSKRKEDFRAGVVAGNLIVKDSNRFNSNAREEQLARISGNGRK